MKNQNLWITFKKVEYKARILRAIKKNNTKEMKQTDRHTEI